MLFKEIIVIGNKNIMREKKKQLCNTYIYGERSASAVDQARGNSTALPCASKERLLA